MVKPKTFMSQLMNLSIPIATTTDEFLSGEFIHWGADNKAAKMGTVGSGETPVCRCVFHDTLGRTDRFGTDKVTILDGEYLAEIDTYDTSGGDFGNGDWLTVKNCTITYYADGKSYTGGFLSPATTGDVVWAQCIVPPGGLQRGLNYMLVKIVSPFVL